jgi:magnesium transporter
MDTKVDFGQDFNAAAIAARLFREHPADCVEILNDLEEEQAVSVIDLLPLKQAVEIFDEPGLERSASFVKALPAAKVSSLLDALSSDERAEIFRELDDESRDEILFLLKSSTRRSVMELLAYPENTAGSIMTTEYVGVPSNWTVSRTLDHIRNVEASRETVYAIYVLLPGSTVLAASVTLRQLITADPDATLLSIAPQRKPIVIKPMMDRTEAARLISKYDLLAVPVVDERNRILGIVTVDDIIDAIVEENTEDAQKFGGMEALGQPYMQIGIGEMLRKRAGWLAVLFLGEMLTANAMQYFETELEKALVLTLFIPLIMSSGGNSGSQATSLIIRALALGELRLRDWWRVALRELPTGMMLGAVLGLIAIGRISAWQWFGFYDYGPHWAILALTVGSALVGIVMFGSLAGSMLPFALKRLGFDPASASAPFVATLVDVTGLVIYFSVAMLILRGTLL